jgi:hypothetical protein
MLQGEVDFERIRVLSCKSPSTFKEDSDLRNVRTFGAPQAPQLIQAESSPPVLRTPLQKHRGRKRDAVLHSQNKFSQRKIPKEFLTQSFVRQLKTITGAWASEASTELCRILWRCYRDPVWVENRGPA